MRLNIDQFKDILERAIFTYVQTFLGLLSASGMGVDMGGISTLKMAALGGLPAAISVIKGAICRGTNRLPKRFYPQNYSADS